MLGIREKLLLLAILLMTLASFVDNYLFLVIISAICFGFVLNLIYRLIVNDQATRFLLLSSLACGAWTTGGFLQSSYYLLGLRHVDFSALFTASVVIIDVKDYALSFAFVFLFIFFSAIFSRFSFIMKAEALFKVYVIERLSAAGLVTWSLSLAGVATALISASFMGLISIRGLAAEFYSDRRILPWWYVLLTFLVSILPLLLSQVFSRLKSVLSLPGIIGLLGLITGLYYSSLFGRFPLLSFVILIPFCWITIQRPRLNFTPRRLLLVCAMSLTFFIVLPFLNSFFSFINIYRVNQGLYTNPILYIASYLEFARSSDSLSAAISKSAENLTSRPLVLWPLAASIKMAFQGHNLGYLYFDDLFNSALNSLPRFLFPGKENLLLQESLLYSRFPFADVDTADSPYLYAFASFGIFGAFMYPLLISLLYWLFLEFTNFASKNGAWFPVSLASTSALINFSIISYGELPTTGLLRQFVVPGSISIVALCAALIRPKWRSQLKARWP
jgi:hypothetical protein